MRRGVSCAYLLARATDTVADESSLDVANRLETLEDMRRLINAADAMGDEGTLARLKQEYAPRLTHQGEKELLARFGECLSMMRELPVEQVELVREVMEYIIDGQAWDIEYFTRHRQVTENDQLTLYTYRVAGCVGEFWTKMGMLCEGEKFSRTPMEEMLEAGRSYGEGLQLVNILRDRREDAENGRSYIPGDSAYWFDRARKDLEQGISYARQLRGIRSRFTTILPALLGLDTLNLIQQSDIGKPKISRRDVKRNIWKALRFSLASPGKA